eukprot:CAMPEP_0184678640 /NCGR_PEP_ID=MMETSP0312-20130426/1403_1 /TAXON_ID=31354 /ORGANISM="Compsopogon coeruleus, Strain SAG 36.94" /LENGTH=281 /DNA_ID=CAMNT_0027127525 /DNA_START=173 /DNA_END=1015 /DNA_ORIENTATION=+
MLHKLQSIGRDERHFDVKLSIRHLEHIPINHAWVWCIWSLPKSQAKPNRGSTEPQLVHDNIVKWSHTINFSVRITSKRKFSTELEPCVLHIAVKCRGPEPRDEELGNVDVDLSEFAGAGEISRNILLRDSLLNSMLKVSANVRLLRGDVIFRRTNRGGDYSSLESTEDPDAMTLTGFDYATDTVTSDDRATGSKNSIGEAELQVAQRHSEVRRALEKLPLNDRRFRELFYGQVFRPESSVPLPVLESRVQARQAVDTLMKNLERSSLSPSALRNATDLSPW